MSQELAQQSRYWDEHLGDFDAIYSHHKGRVSVLLDVLFRWDMYGRFDYTMRNAEPLAGRTVLDVGCGTGRYALDFARRNARHVVGLDISEQMIRTCEARAHEARMSDRCSLVHTDLLAYRPDRTFDVSIGIGLFDYIRDPLPVLKKMRECTQDRAIASFPRRWTWRAPVRKVRLGLQHCSVYFYARGDIERLVREAGFAGCRMERIGQLYCVTASVR